MHGEDSAPKEKLNWYCMKVLSAHTHTKTLLQKTLLPAAQEWFQDEKDGWEAATRQGVLSHGKVHQAVVGAAWGCGGGRVAH